jgi:flagellar brake protein
MALTLQPQFLPETDVEALAPFRVEGPVAIKSLLRDLISKKALIALYSLRNFDDFIVTQVVRFDDHGLELDFVTDEARRAAILGGGGAIVIGFLETIKIQFTVQSIQLFRSHDGPVLRCPLPANVYRIQRRDSYRVRPLQGEPVVCFVRDGAGGESGFRVIDFSAGGLALAVPSGSALPAAGQTLRHCRIEVGKRIAIPCELIVRHVSEGLWSEDGAHRIGCEYDRPTSEAARSLQLVVMDIEKRSRHSAGATA